MIACCALYASVQSFHLRTLTHPWLCWSESQKSGQTYSSADGSCCKLFVSDVTNLMRCARDVTLRSQALYEYTLDTKLFYFRLTACLATHVQGTEG